MAMLTKAEVNQLKDSIFIVESIAHLKGLESELIPIAELLRAIMAKMGV